MFSRADDLSPEAREYLAHLQTMLHTLVQEGAPPPAHHSSLTPVAYETALAWARASAHETLSAPTPTPQDGVSERYFESVVKLFPLGFEAFTFYVGLLEEAIGFDSNNDQTSAAVESLTDSLAAGFMGPASDGALSSRDPAAVLLLMYLRFYAVLHTATHLTSDEVADRAAVALGLVMVNTHPR